MELEATSPTPSTALPGKDGEEWFSDLLEAAKQELTRRDYRIAQLERQLALAQSELERARDQSSRLEIQAGEQEEHIASLNIRLAEMGEQMRQVEEELGNADRRLRTAETLEQSHDQEIQRLESENDALLITNDEQARRIRALDQIIDGYVASNARIRSDFEKLRLVMKRPSGMVG